MLTASALVARLGGRLWIGVYRCTLVAMLVRVLVWSLVFARACVCVCVCAWRTVVGAHVWVCIHCLQVADLCSATCLSCECGGAQGRRRTLLRRCMITFVRSMGTRSWLYAGHCGHRGCQTVQ